MRHRISKRHLGRTTSHRKSLIRNQVTDLLRHDRIVTTEAKAKEVRPIAERVITLGKHDNLGARRKAGAVLTDDKVLLRLFQEVGPRFQDRPGGYTRIIKLGPRLGDGARMAQIELVESADSDAIIESTADVTADASAAAPASDTADVAASDTASDASDNAVEIENPADDPAHQAGDEETESSPEDSPKDEESKEDA
jgi:large subunit ribosomal protein L17